MGAMITFRPSTRFQIRQRCLMYRARAFCFELKLQKLMIKGRVVSIMKLFICRSGMCKTMGLPRGFPLILFLALTGVLYAFLTAAHEPQFHGRTLNSWLDDLARVD